MLDSGLSDFPRSDRVLGWWDRTVPSASLGTLAIVVAETILIGKLCGAERVEIAVHRDGLEGWRPVEKADDLILSLLLSLKPVDAAYACAAWTGYRELAAANAGSCCWPDPRQPPRTDYDTMQIVQALWRRTGIFPEIGFRHAVKAEAQRRIQALRRRSSDRRAPKNVPNPGSGAISVANHAAWLTFCPRRRVIRCRFSVAGRR